MIIKSSKLNSKDTISTQYTLNRDQITNLIGRSHKFNDANKEKGIGRLLMGTKEDTSEENLL